MPSPLQLARRESVLAETQTQLRAERQARARAESHGNGAAGALLEKDTRISDLTAQLAALEKEPDGALPQLRQRVAALSEEKQTLEASLGRAVRAAQEGDAASQSLRVAAHEAEARARKAEQHAVQQASQLKRSMDELARAQTRVGELESREREAKREWESGKTSNAHALRMVGTLQSETSQAHERANELTVALRIAQGEVEALSGKVKLGDNERRNMEERMSQLRQELRKLSVQLAAKTEECARVRVEYEKAHVAEANANNSSGEAGGDGGAGGDNRHMDELSSIMLERDTLSHSNDELHHRNEQVSVNELTVIYCQSSFFSASIMPVCVCVCVCQTRERERV